MRAVGVAPNFKGPAGKPVSDAADLNSSALCNKSLACSTTRAPVIVGLTVRPALVRSLHPSSASKARSCCATVVGARSSLRAASAIDPESTTVTKLCRKRLSIQRILRFLNPINAYFFYCSVKYRLGTSINVSRRNKCLLFNPLKFVSHAYH